jgi:hypothetical protein
MCYLCASVNTAVLTIDTKTRVALVTADRIRLTTIINRDEQDRMRQSFMQQL